MSDHTWPTGGGHGSSTAADEARDRAFQGDVARGAPVSANGNRDQGVTHRLRVAPSRSMKATTGEVEALLDGLEESSRRSCGLLASELIAQVTGQAPGFDGGPIGLTVQLREDAVRLEARGPVAPSVQATADHDVDGIKCEHNAKLLFHVHTHLTVFVNGAQRTIPAGVGVDPPITRDNYRPSPIGPQFGETPGQCLAWLSTRYADGLIHVESSEQRTFTLGDFFAVWGQPLSKTELGPEQGEVTAIVDNQAWTGDPADIPLASHTQIQLMLGKPLIAPQTIQFPGAY